jgi:hypothetical protein
MLGVMAAVAMTATAAWAAQAGGKDAKDGTKVFTAGDGSVTITVKTDANAPAKKPDGMKIEIREAGKETKESGQKVEQPGMHVKTIQVRPGVEMTGEAKVEAKAVAADGGWAGIHVTPVPAAVAAQLDLSGRGAMVANIAKGSPAEKAGLQRYDVVVAMDKGQAVENVEAFVTCIRSHKPGEQVELAVIRKGAKMPATLALAAPPPADAKVGYVYEQDADESWQDQLKFHKGLIRKGPQGWTMVMPEGGATAEGPVTIPLPPELLKAMPNPGYGDFFIARGGMGDAKKSFKVFKKTEGATIEVEGTLDGSIVVRRTGPGDKKTEAKFANAEELKQKDAEAFDLYKGVTTNKVPQGAGGGSDSIYFRPTIVIDGKAVSKEAAEKARQVEKELEKWLKEWSEKAKHESLEAREHIARAENGAINVTIHEDGDTAKLTFKGEAEMKEKAPKAFEAYQKLLKGGK